MIGISFNQIGGGMSGSFGMGSGLSIGMSGGSLPMGMGMGIGFSFGSDSSLFSRDVFDGGRSGFFHPLMSGNFGQHQCGCQNGMGMVPGMGSPSMMMGGGQQSMQMMMQMLMKMIQMMQGMMGGFENPMMGSGGFGGFPGAGLGNPVRMSMPGGIGMPGTGMPGGFGMPGGYTGTAGQIPGGHERIGGHSLPGGHVEPGGGPRSVNGSPIGTARPENTGSISPAPEANPSEEIPSFGSNPNKAQIGQMLDAAAKKYGIPPNILKAVAWQESTWNPKAKSFDGGHGKGVMQIDDRYHKFARTKDVWDPVKNIDYGSKYLSDLRKKNGSWSKALKRYNGGSSYPPKIMKHARNKPWAKYEKAAGKTKSTTGASSKSASSSARVATGKREGKLAGRPHGLAEIKKMFGKPGTNQTTTVMPAGPGGKNRRVTCHKKIAPKMKAVFDEIKEKGLSKHIKQFSGSYNNRSKRGGSRKSTHAWGIAVDLNAGTHPMGRRSQTQGQRAIAEIFKKHGFYQLPSDPMHFQYATGY